ncbi:Phage tail assembly chaperone protein, TAC [Novosphingobium sp. CF614]|uniref:phage tail assembly chaperone n=1 Tax=Novosphingobium sp. CF614 TaxID=1884364 RepID=UPI0008DF2937|nr:Phage tail assembly chaperone protein, TAC [Novosphingobium sp. CF614]
MTRRFAERAACPLSSSWRDGEPGKEAGGGDANGSFALAALALCGLAARGLGWRPHEFWAATPAELATALGLPSPGAVQPGLDRETLQRLMEHDHER